MAGLAAAPLLALAAAFFLGLALPLPPATGWAVVVLLPLGPWAGPRLGTAALLLAACAAGAANRPPPAVTGSLAQVVGAFGEERLRRPVRLAGVLARSPAEYHDRTELRVAVDTVAANRRVWAVDGLASVRVDGEARESLRPLARGARIAVWARATLPRPASNPGGREPGGPVAVFAQTKSALLVVEEQPAPGFLRAVQGLRRTIRERWLASGLDPAATAVIVAVLTGDRTLAGGELARSFRDAGTLHVMAVSGLHVGAVGLMLYGVLAFCGVRRSTALGLILLALPFYVALCDASPSVLRAALMAGAVIVAVRRGITGSALNGIGLAAVALLAWDPANALDVGFQLSFAATLSIVAVFQRRHPTAQSWDPPGPLGRFRFWALGLVVVTLAAQVGVFPVLAWHFQRVVLTAVPVSVPATLLAGPILASGFGWLLLGGVPLLGPALLAIAGWSAGVLVAISGWGAALPFAAVGIPPPGWEFLVGWLALSAALLLAPRRWVWIPALGMVGLALALLPRPAPADGSLTVTALDVGMGDALVVTLPEGGALVVDAGTAFQDVSVGERVVVPYLLATGSLPVRAAVATHGDIDHIGGFAGLFREFTPGSLWRGSGLTADDRAAVRNLRRDAARRGIPRRLLRTGERFRLGGADFHVLFADPPAALEGVNEGSLVLMVEHAGRRVLLTGDAGEPTEKLLLERRRADLRADVLKVGHHGSRSSTSPAFLAAVAPGVAIVSTREDPRRRLPAPSVLARLEAAGVQVYRTDHHGAVRVRIGPDGRLEVSSYR